MGTTTIESAYIAWLQSKRVPLFEGAGTYWTLYQGALVPATPAPTYLELSRDEAHELIRISGAWLIRYSSRPSDCQTSWWYVVCDQYDPDRHSAKTRQNIKRGRRECSVEEISAEWISGHGHDCYVAAFGRYRDQRPVSAGDFKKGILDTADGPFAYWGVFHQGKLCGYCQCIVDGKQAITNVTKYHPEYLRHRSAYALMDSLIQTYVAEQNMTMSNGSRSVAHNTNYQEVLISLGFRKQFCRLNISYNPWLKLGIDLMYPARSLLARLPDRRIIHKVRALMYQEELRKNCNAG